MANDACDAGKISVNGKAAKASYEVKVGDIIEIQMGSKAIKAEITAVTEVVRKENAADMYRILS